MIYIHNIYLQILAYFISEIFLQSDLFLNCRLPLRILDHFSTCGSAKTKFTQEYMMVLDARRELDKEGWEFMEIGRVNIKLS